MAVTKILPRSGGLQQAIDYVLNGDKTDDCILTAHFNCDPGREYRQMMQTKRETHRTDGRQCYHIIQSFRPGEITPELALEIAKEFVREHLDGFEAVIGTHVDRHHIHSHIVFNSVNADTGEKYHSMVTTIIDSSGLTAMSASALPDEMTSIIEDVGFIDSIPLWAVTLLGSLFIWVLSLVMILTVYSRFFKLYIATAIAPVPLASFAGQPSSSIGIAFLKSYAAICLEGCVIVLACVIFSAFASSPPAIADDTLAAATIVWNYVGELIFNMLVLVGAIKMSDRIIRELMGLG